MLVLDLGDLRNLIESAATAVSVLGGAMAIESGSAAKKATYEGWGPPVVAQLINESLGRGFSWGLPTATFCLMILLWT